MHYGFALRYHGMFDREGLPESLLQLESSVGGIGKDELSQITPLLETHAWRVGWMQMRTLPTRVWTDLSPKARARYLAGFSYNLSSSSNSPDINAVISGDILQKLAAASLDAECTAEIGANAIRSNCLDVVKAVLVHRNFDPDGHVCRNPENSNQNHFAQQLSSLSTRVLDVLLEAAVRCQKPEAARILLDLGASPDLPCWNLERSFNDWFSLLSFSLDGMNQTDGDAPMALVDLLLEYGANPQGLECEGKNNPLIHAIYRNHWELVDRLLELGARFDGGMDETAKRLRAEPSRMYYSQADLDWVTQALGPLIPLVNFWEVPWFFKGHAQGGYHRTFLSYFLKDNELPMLKKYVARGLPTKLTSTIVLDMVKGGYCQALSYLLRDNPNLPQVLSRICERRPDFCSPKLSDIQ
ncbi:hypothetical protein GCM10023213_18450 [Prosthecobacter algae]|uniref:Ankyrin repeat protein n=2 Tax=Prosthecobacter algae TaxID=1144682 RepID=A0ABP9P1P3_9BACT